MPGFVLRRGGQNPANVAIEAWNDDLSVDRAVAGRDWSATPLGPRRSWPESLKTALGIALQSRFPIIIFWGPELVQLYNEAYRPLIGDKHPRALGQRARDCFPEVWESIGPMLHGVLETGGATWSEDLMLPLVRDGKPGEYYFTFSYSPITDATGVAGVFCAVQETTAAVVGRRDAETRARALTELNRAKSTFLSNISHEFRTPLSLILAPLAAAEPRIQDAEARESIDVATRNALRLQRLVDSLLAFSRIEAGRLEPRFTSVELVTFTRELVSAFESLAKRAGLRLAFHGSEAAPATVDRDMWERIVFNLIENALKYTLAGSIDVRVRTTGDAVVLEVADTGIGVAEEEREKIFERFYRAASSGGRSAEGAGIGLALTRDLVRLHSGTISVRDNDGGGSVFAVSIPRSAHASSAVQTEHFQGSAGEFLTKATSWLQDTQRPNNDLSVTNRPRVLVVDDNADLRSYLERLLHSRYHVLVARNGEDALETIELHHPDLVLSDMMMPRMDGNALVRSIRALPNGNDIAVVLLSARSGSEAVAEGLASGADDYVSKPFSATELIARIDAQLRLQQARRAADEKLAQNTIEFQALADILPSMIWTATADGSREFTNTAWRVYTGLPQGQPWENAIYPDDREVFLRRWREVTTDPNARFSLDYRLWNAGVARFRWVTARAQRVRVGSEDLWIGTTIDIDERKRRELANEMLSRAGVVLNQSLSISDTILQIAMLAVHGLSDYCVFYTVEDGVIKRAAWLHRDPTMQGVLDDVIQNGGDPNDPDWIIAKVVSRNEPSRWARDEEIASFVRSPRLEKLFEQLDLSAALFLPVNVGTTVYGALALARTGDRSAFDEIDIDTATQLASRAAVALANSDVYEREHRIAYSFQSAALPDAISTRDGIEIDAHYVASRSEARVGGDWYDTELLPDGRVLVSIGDVSGSGLEAAVVMSMMRTAIRSVAHVYADPATILEAAQGGTERRIKDHFATVFLAVIDPVMGRMTYASAGHVRPLLFVEGSTIELAAPGLPIGTFFDGRRTSEVMALPPRSTLLLYTDGLIEGAGPFLPGEEALRTFVQSQAFRERPLARTLYESLLPQGGSDDVAILIARISLPDARTATHRLELVIENGKDAVRARDRICATLAQTCSLSGDALETARLIVGELTANVSRHAPGEAIAVVDCWNRDPVFHLVDRGAGFRYSNRLPPIFSENGRGLFIASALARRVEVLPDIDGGSHVIAVLER